MQNSISKIINSKFFYSFLIFFIFSTFQIFLGVINKPSFSIWPDESLNIARSIVEGNGFSNPFRYETGPTAWVAPLIPLIYAATLIIFGESIWGYLFLGLLGKFLIAISFYFIQESFKKYRIHYNRFVLFIIFMVYFSIFTQVHYSIFSDVDLFTLFTSLLLFYSYDLIYYNQLKELLVLSFLIPLSLTAFALPFITFFLLLFIFWLIKQSIGFNPLHINNKLKFTHFLLTGLIFLFSVSIWSARNYLVFNKLIISKSNVWFEFHMSNIVDEKGLLNNSTWRKEHPMGNRYLCRLILYQGEIRWLEQFKESGQDYQSINNPDYMKKVVNRMKNIFLFTDFSYDFISTDYLRTLDNEKKKIFENKNLILYDSYLTLQHSETDFYSIINTIEMTESEKEMLLSDWNDAKILLQKDKIAPTRIFHGITRATLPSISILVLLILSFLGIFKNKVYFGIALILYISYFIPFILISHGSRYQLFVVLLQILFVNLLVMEIFKVFRSNNSQFQCRLLRMFHNRL